MGHCLAHGAYDGFTCSVCDMQATVAEASRDADRRHEEALAGQRDALAHHREELAETLARDAFERSHELAAERERMEELAERAREERERDAERAEEDHERRLEEIRETIENKDVIEAGGLSKRAQQAIAAGLHADGAALLRRATALDPVNPDLRISLATCEARLGRASEARAALEAAIRIAAQKKDRALYADRLVPAAATVGDAALVGRAVRDALGLVSFEPALSLAQLVAARAGRPAQSAMGLPLKHRLEGARASRKLLADLRAAARPIDADGEAALRGAEQAGEAALAALEAEQREVTAAEEAEEAARKAAALALAEAWARRSVPRKIWDAADLTFSKVVWMAALVLALLAAAQIPLRGLSLGSYGATAGLMGAAIFLTFVADGISGQVGDALAATVFGGALWPLGGLYFLWMWVGRMRMSALQARAGGGSGLYVEPESALVLVPVTLALSAGAIFAERQATAPATTAPTAPLAPSDAPSGAARTAARLNVVKAHASTAMNKPPHDVHPAAHAFDGDPATAWCESAPGPGKNEWLEADLGAPFAIERIELSTGFDHVSPKHGDLFTANAHAKQVRVLVDGKVVATPTVDAQQRAITVDGLQVRGKVVRFVFEDVYPGKRWQDLSVSEVALFGGP